MHSDSLKHFPKVLVTVEGKKKFHTFKEAAILQDSWFAKVKVEDMILNEDFSIRNITKEEIE